MERADRKSKRERKSPRVPIKTYKWEDVRRSRKRGGYPWTYLYKQPYDENVDPSEFTMEGLRKAKSTSTVGGKSYLTISEMTESEREGSVTPDVERMDTTLQIITEPDDHSIKLSASSVVIEECDVSERENKRPEFILDSAESSDDVSQYLDKEDRGPEKDQPAQEEMELDTSTKVDDTTKRKRKLSGESSYSKISQTKSALMQKLKDTKNKIKVPKFSLSVSKLKKPAQKKLKSSPPQVKKERKKSNGQKKDNKPVYIHIPLKPPENETDEFSHLEFQSKSDDQTQPQTKRPGSFKDLVRSMRQVKETKPIEEDPNEEKLDLREDMGSSENINEEMLDFTEQEVEDEIVDESSKSDATKETETNKTADIQIEVDKNEEAKTEDKGIQDYVCTNEKKTVLTSVDVDMKETELKVPEQGPSSSTQAEMDENTQEPEPDNESGEVKGDDFDHLFEASSSKKTKEADLGRPTERPVRSRSAEPEKRRKLSLESSYSRKSLSKLGILKKLRDASDKIKSTLTRSGSKASSKPKIVGEIKKEPQEPKKSKKLAPQKFPDPVYIHIPLKPPEGEEDEFSHLVDESVQPKKPTQPAEIETPSTPDSTLQGSDVQLIILTAPSDDEILEYHSSDVPETPSSESGFFDKIDELKQLAKGAVDVVTTPKLESVKEENGSDKVSIEEKAEDTKVEKKKEKPDMISDKVVDVEDGLSESKSRIPVESLAPKEVPQPVPPQVEIKEADEKEIKSVLKTAGSPIMKKKVSFKRRSKTPKDGSYEDIEAPELEGDSTKTVKQPSHTLGVEEKKADAEDKGYLDNDTVKTTSLEEDFNKWSKISDHEYEPINPPPDNIAVVPFTQQVASTMPAYTFNNDSDTEFLPLGDVPLDATPKMRSDFAVQYQPEPEEAHGTVSPNVTFAPTPEASPAPSEKPKSASSRFQMAFKQKTDDIKNKLHNIKKPNIHLPDRPKFNKPNFQKFKIEKPKFSLPKIPDTAKISMPSFSLPRRHTSKRPLKQRQHSTESNAGDASDSKKPIFDFSTYPRLFKKKQKPEGRSAETIPSFATVPRSKTTDSSTVQESSKWSGSDSVRIPLHSEDSMEAEYIQDAPEETVKENYDDESIDNDNPSHIRYGEDIDIEDEYDRDNREIKEITRDYLNRWDRGTFTSDQGGNRFPNSEKITDLDSPEEPPRGYDFNANHRESRTNRDNRDNYSSGSSHGPQMQSGVLEEINSDEFLWRQKGISEENMDIRMYLSSEIREAFRTPANALSKLGDEHERHYDLRGSNQSLPEAPPKKKSIKKPKRKKTPHASQEQIPYAGESADDDLEEIPSRPRRRSKRTRKPKQQEEVIPYQETISVDIGRPEDQFRHRESLGGILGDDEGEEDSIMYENEMMEGKEQPEIHVTDPYKGMKFVDEDIIPKKPAAPPRKPKSLKSLTVSENDSIFNDVAANLESEIEVIKTDSKVIIPIQDEPPKRPSRSNSRRSSRSRGASQLDIDSLSRTMEEPQEPCIEEPCIQDIRDSMGYAIIDKTKCRDPPLPPPRSLRKKRSPKTDDDKFFTVPRRHVDEIPMRPLRNYSTLTQVKKTFEPSTNTYENKENIDITGYVEIDDEPNIDLQSGEVIQKMKDRPLPAPPRPPRKSRLEARSLQDITSRENIMLDQDTETEKHFEEIDTATQTEPLPDDFICEEMIQEPTDTIIIASRDKQEEQLMMERSLMSPQEQTDHIVISSIDKQEPVRVERHLITPTVYHYEETVTHGSLLVDPLDGATILPDSELIRESKERIIPVTRESDLDETSSIPEDFHKLKQPAQAHKEPTETELMKTHKLQVTDLDVDTLTVHKLLADKILVSEIESSSLSTNEISSKTGSLKVGEINLPPGVIEEIIRTIQSTIPSPAQQALSTEQRSESATGGQKKNFDE